MSEPEALVDEARLGAWLEANVPRASERFAVVRHQAGHSNETFFVDWGERRLVLRRPPRGAFLPTAHDVLREARVLAGLAGTEARVPAVVAVCDDPAVLGAPFYLMERVDGVVLRDRLPPDLGEAARAAIGDELVDALAAIHRVAWAGTPLTALGKPDGYLERQVRRWTGQMEMTLPFTEESRPVPELAEVGKWLAANVPPTPRTTVVHGDYKLDNVILRLDGDRPRLAAVVDWEMATLGDPLADVGWMLSFWREAGDPADHLPSVAPRFTEGPGFRTRAQLVARYERATGLRVQNLRFYEALAVWKLAILLEGSYARHLAGLTDDPLFAEMERAVPALARRALAISRGEVPV